MRMYQMDFAVYREGTVSCSKDYEDIAKGGVIAEVFIGVLGNLSLPVEALSP